SEMAHVYRFNLIDFENGKELVFAEFEKSVALAFVELFKIENVFVKRDRLFNVVHFNRNMITAVNINARPAPTAHFRIYIAVSGKKTTAGRNKRRLLRALR